MQIPQVTKFINLSLDDIQGSQLLYTEENYRNSYFLFQQASEKANKALMVFTGSNEKEVKDIGHDQMKPMRKQLVEQRENMDQWINVLTFIPSILDKDSLNLFEFEKQSDSLSKSISFIDSLRQIDLTELTQSNLDKFKELIDAAKNMEIPIPNSTDMPDFQNAKRFILSVFSSPPFSSEYMEGLEEVINDDDLILKALQMALPMIKPIIYVQIVFWITGILTIQHSSLSRYGNDTHDVFSLYNPSLPIVKSQPIFLRHLEEGVHVLNQLIPTDNQN